MNDVYVLGAAHTHFGEQWQRSHRDLLVEAGLKAIEDGRINGEDIDALFIGSMSSGKFLGQEHVAALVLDEAGLADTNIPSTRIENGAASGGVALRLGYEAIRSGQSNLVVVAGLEKMTDVSDSDAQQISSSGIDQEWEAFHGATDAALHALVAKRHMRTHGTTREMLAEVAVKNHRHGTKNPLAQFQREITRDQVLGAPMIADPIGMFDQSPLSDGAACIVLGSKSYVKNNPVRITGSAQATDRMRIADREDYSRFNSARIAARNAYSQAGISAGDIHLAELHDSYTISEIVLLEELGISKLGEGGIDTMEGRTTFGGGCVVNPSGGLKARGNPLGATGIAQAVELTWQLRQTAGPRQVVGAEVGVCLNMGGVGTTSVAHVLERGAA